MPMTADDIRAIILQLQAEIDDLRAQVTRRQDEIRVLNAFLEWARV